MLYKKRHSCIRKVCYIYDILKAREREQKEKEGRVAKRDPLYYFFVSEEIKTKFYNTKVVEITDKPRSVRYFFGHRRRKFDKTSQSHVYI